MVAMQWEPVVARQPLVVEVAMVSIRAQHP